MYATCGNDSDIYTNISLTNSGTITSLTTINRDSTDSKIFYYFVTELKRATPSTGGSDGNNLAVVFRYVNTSNPPT